MGNGAFDIESADIPPVLVLLDRHGWEIMRKPLPTSTYPYGDELDALRVYDSPMVKEYHFFNNATKASSQQRFQALVVLKRDAFIKVRQFISCKDTKNLV